MGILYRDCYIPCFNSIQLKLWRGGSRGTEATLFLSDFLFFCFSTSNSLYMHFYMGSTEGVCKTQCPCHIRWHLDTFNGAADYDIF